MLVISAHVSITFKKENFQIEPRALGFLGVGHSPWFCSWKQRPFPAERGSPACRQVPSLHRRSCPGPSKPSGWMFCKSCDARSTPRFVLDDEMSHTGRSGAALENCAVQGRLSDVLLRTGVF